jgi:hypothetical protein
MFEDLFDDILDEKENNNKEEDEIFDETRDFELFQDNETQDVPDIWITSNINVDDADIWSTDEVWNTAN